MNQGDKLTLINSNESYRSNQNYIIEMNQSCQSTLSEANELILVINIIRYK